MRPIATFLFCSYSVQKKKDQLLHLFGILRLKSLFTISCVYPATTSPNQLTREGWKFQALYFIFLFCLYHLFVLELQFYLTKPWRLEQKLPRLWFSYMVCTLRRIFKCAENHFPRWIFLKYRVFSSKCFPYLSCDKYVLGNREMASVMSLSVRETFFNAKPLIAFSHLTHYSAFTP